MASAAPLSAALCVPDAATVIAAPVAPAIAPVWNVSFGAPVAFVPETGTAASQSTQTAGQPSARPRAIEYSHGYEVRRKIHVAASVATLPLFVTQVVLGQKLYDGSGGSVKTAHSAVATSIAVLFGVNSVTGVWNLIEARKDPHQRALRMTHGILMLAADAGFVATGLLAPDSEEPGSFVNDRGPHRTVAYTSIGVATASYLLMLFAR